MRPWLRLLVVPAALAAATVFPHPGGFIEQAQSQQSGAIIEADVLGALQEDSEVAVIISLPPPAVPVAEVNLTDMGTPISTRGDVNCDSETNSVDAVLVLQFDAGLIDSMACQAAADVYPDGNIDSRDAAIILQIQAGLCCVWAIG